MGRKLSDRLEEEIQQGVYLAKKLDELDAELLEEKVDCLTRLNDCKDSKIHSLQTELTHKSRELETLQCELEGVRVESEKMEKLLTQREEEMAQMYRQLEEREQELCDFNTC
jgi:chromosome segregation ATPase